VPVKKEKVPEKKATTAPKPIAKAAKSPATAAKASPAPALPQKEEKKPVEPIKTLSQASTSSEADSDQTQVEHSDESILE
jgi:hypothetical protein